MTVRWISLYLIMSSNISTICKRSRFGPSLGILSAGFCLGRMKLLLVSWMVVWAVVATAKNRAAFETSSFLSKRDVVSSLGPHLSPDAVIYTPRSPSWANESSRYSTYHQPTFNYVVVPAVEEDIIITVGYCILAIKKAYRWNQAAICIVP